MNVVNVLPMSPSSHPPPRPVPHRTVLRDEVVAEVEPVAEGTYIDATLGAGGHTEALLDAGAGTVIGIDRDPTALRLAEARLASFGNRFVPIHAAFSDLETVLDDLAIPGVNGIVADLGVSSMQLDDPERGMSFRAAGPLDMRMDPTRGETALELVERLDDDELTELIAKLGEERRARRVARCIKQAEEAGELNTTLDLRRAVVRAVGPNRVGGVDPATRTFQALRIAVNAELLEIEALVDAAARALKPEGVLVVIAFHSLEDRIVKRKLRQEEWKLPFKKPRVPSDDEIDDNPRARSAKLRVGYRRGLDA